jgi:hypothetical protein
VHVVGRVGPKDLGIVEIPDEFLLGPKHPGSSQKAGQVPWLSGMSARISK